MMKKLSTAFFISLLVLCFALLIPVGAQDETGIILRPEEAHYLAPQTNSATFDDYVDVDEFREYLRAEFNKFNTQISIYSFRIPHTLETQIFRFIDEILPDCFHADVTRVSYKGAYYNNITVEYLMTESEYEDCLVIWNETVDKMTSDLVDNDALTDVQKALLIHDRMIIHCEYDKERLDNKTMPEISYTPAGVLVYGIAVCQGYAEAYTYLLDLVGIESYLCSSAKLNHSWNIVKIDGDYFYVDVTWDDPTWDRSGRALHLNFLCSYEVFKESHDADDYDTTPQNTKYDDWFWLDSSAAFEYVNGEIYYIDHAEQQLELYDGTPVLSVQNLWLATSTSVWRGNFTYLDSYDNKLFFSQPGAIYSYNTVNKTVKCEFEPDHGFSMEGKIFNIFGFKIKDEKFVCEICYTPNFDADTKKNYTVIGEMDIQEKYSVKFDANGGSGAPEEQIKIEDEPLILSFATPVRSGYSFRGWSSVKDGSVEYAPGSTYLKNEPLTLYAVWKKNTVDVTGISLNFTEKDMNTGDVFLLEATVSPSNASNKKIIWTSSNEDIVYVSSDGGIVAIAEGKASVTAETEDGGKKAVCEITVYPLPEGKLTLSLGEKKITAGKTVEIPLSVSNNPGISGLSVKIGYNSSVMTLKGYRSADGWTAASDFDQNETKNPVTFTWLSDKNIRMNGKLLILVFEIAEDAELGKYDITLSANGYVGNDNLEKVECELADGSIEIADYIVGDADGNGEITISDAVLLAQFLANWEVEVNEAALDCDGNGKVAIADAVILAQHLAGWSVTLG